MKLNVPYIKQKKNTCGPSSLQQVLAYYGKDITLDEILKNTKMFKYGTWTSYLGISAMKFGFKTKMIYYDAKYIDPTWFNLAKNKLMNKLRNYLRREKQQMKKEGIVSLLDYLKTNGKIILKIPSKKLLISYLKQKIPIIICLSSTILHQRKRFDSKKSRSSEYGKPLGHFVVISGYENGKFIAADPSSEHGGINKISEDMLIFSWFFYGGDALIVEKVKK